MDSMKKLISDEEFDFNVSEICDFYNRVRLPGYYVRKGEHYKLDDTPLFLRELRHDGSVQGALLC